MGRSFSIVSTLRYNSDRSLIFHSSLLILIFFCFFGSDLNAQKIGWAFKIGGNLNQRVTDMTVDKQGNLITVGRFSGTNIDFDPSLSGTAYLTTLSYPDIFVAKYDSSGNFMWAFKVGGQDVDAAKHVTVDSLGNIYVSGFFRGQNVDFDPSPTNTFYLSALGSSSYNLVSGGDAFLAKYSPGGSLLWALNVGGNTVEDEGGDVVVDRSGNVFWTGNFRGTNIDFDPSPAVNSLTSLGYTDVFLAKYSASGQFMFVKSFGGASSQIVCSSLLIDNNANLYLSGRFNGTIDLDPGPGVHTVSFANSTSGCTNLFLVKLDSLAQYSWGFKIGGTTCGNVYGTGLGIDTANNICIGGYYTGQNVDFDPGPGNLVFSNSNSKSFLASYTSNGDLIFARSIGSNFGCQAYAMVTLDDGFVLTGLFSGNTDFDPGAASFELSSAGYSDIFVSKYSYTGDHQTAFRLGSDLREVAYAAAHDGHGNIYIGGEFQSNMIDFDPQATNYIIHKEGLNDPSPSYDAFVAKYSDLHTSNSQPANKVNGYLFVDKNSNGIKDNFEPFYNSASILCKKGNIDSVRIISSTGHFSFSIDTGSYVTTIQSYLPYYNVLPVSKTTGFATYGNTDTISFALQPIPAKRDLSLTIIPVNRVRTGSYIHYKLLYVNKGTDTIANGSIQFIKSPFMDNVSSSPAYSALSGDTITWNYSNLNPLDTGIISLQLRTVSPPLLSLSDSIKTKATIYPVNSDLFPADNTFYLQQRVVGSFDPNDKAESHDGKLNYSEVLNEYLNYFIRFQNTGNDTAFNVSITDTLSSKLDWSTIEVISSSHPYQLIIEDGNLCRFQFPNINLVDSITNEMLSHGFISYRVKPISTVVPGDVIHNTAYIYFDDNLPIVTNTTSTLIVTENPMPLKLIAFNGKKMSNGQISLYWLTNNEINVREFEIEQSVNGRDFIRINGVAAKGGLNNNYVYIADHFYAPIVHYRLKIIDNDGRFSNSSIISFKNNRKGNSELSIDINPARDQLIVTVYSNHLANTSAVLVNTSGTIVKKFALKEGTQFFSTDDLSPGMYYLKSLAGVEKFLVVR